MDALGSFEKAIATPRFLMTAVVCLVLIGVGIYLLTTSSGVTVAFGGLMLLSGITSLFAAWIKRNIVRNNSTAASIVGVLDVARLVRRL
jgi:hypothetical protein